MPIALALAGTAPTPPPSPAGQARIAEEDCGDEAAGGDDGEPLPGLRPATRGGQRARDLVGARCRVVCGHLGSRGS